MIGQSNGGFLIGQIKQRQARIFERILNEHGIQEFNGAQGRILYILWNHNNIPISEISERTGLAKTTLTSMLDRMEQAGLVCRVADDKDRRKVKVVITEKTRKLNDEYQEVSEQMNEIFYEGFTNDECTQFEDYLNRILTNLIKNEKEQ